MNVMPRAAAAYGPGLLHDLRTLDAGVVSE